MSNGRAKRRSEQNEKPQWMGIWLLLILLTNLLITLAYGAINPLFEAPDEQFHYYTVQLIADNGQLPYVPAGEIEDAWISQEAAQPPLYYLIGAAIAAAIDTSNAREAIWPNKYPAMGEAGELNNRNIFIHTSSESWPWKGYALAVHLLRIFSALLSTGTLVCVYGSGRMLWPADPYRALLATGLVAFLPQFNFLFASVSNDTLVIFLASAAIWQLIRIWRTELMRGRLLLLGITLGLAMLSKNAGLVLLVYSCGFVLLKAIRDLWNPANQWGGSGNQGQPRSESRVLLPLLGRILLFMVIPALLLAGWVYARNYLIYGELTATNQFLRFSSGDRQATVLQVFGESIGLWLSLIAVFGWFNVRPPDWVYWFWNGIVLLAVMGAIWYRLRHQKKLAGYRPGTNLARAWRDKMALFLAGDWVLPLLLAGWVLLIYASLFLFMLRTEAAQGRLLYPALVPLSLGLAYGWTANPAQRRFSVVLTPLALLVTIYCLWFVIQPTYARPQQLVELPQEAQEINVSLGEGLILVGSEMETKEAKAGDAVWMTLYWRADSVPEAPIEHVLSVFGRNGVEIGKLHSYHGRGLYPANLWPVNTIIADRFAVYLSEEISTPVLAPIESGLAGEGFSAQVGEVKITPEAWPEPKQPELARLGDTIALTSVAIDPQQAHTGDTIEVNVQWHVLAFPGRDLTTLVHLGQPDQAPITVGDRPPLNGAYPTRAWTGGEVIDDSYIITLPDNLAPGRYPLWLGMYDSQTIERLPVTINGEAQANHVILAGWVEIE